MATLTPFKAIHFHPSYYGRLPNLISPPYDVISESERMTMLSRDPYNFVRLLLGDDKYRSYNDRGRLFREWLTQGILVRDEVPKIFIQRERFALGQKIYERAGIFAAVKLEDFQQKVILPHEQIFEAPKKDQLSLMEAVQAQLSSVFAIVDDAAGLCSQFLNLMTSDRGGESPIMDFTDDKGTQHTLWSLSDPRWIAKVTEYFENRQLFLVDGHHRYAAALENSQSQNKRGHHSSLKDYVLMYICPAQSEGLAVLPIHRALRLHDPEKVKQKIFQNDKWRLIPFSKKPALLEEGDVCLIQWVGDERWYSLKNLKTESSSTRGAIDKIYWLHRNFFPELSITPEEIIYIKGTEDGILLAQEELTRGEIAALFHLSDVPVQEIMKLASRGKKLPQKSTFFYPKVMAGQLIYSFE